MSAKNVKYVIGAIGTVCLGFTASIPVIEVETVIDDRVINRDFARPQFAFSSNEEIKQEFDRNLLGTEEYVQKEFLSHDEEDLYVKTWLWNRCYNWYLGRCHDGYRCIKKP